MRFRNTWLSRACKRVVLDSSEFAARRGWSLATYNPALFAFYHVLARDNAPGVVGAVADTFPDARSYLDVGAGSGAFSAEARRRGKYVVACENSPFGRAVAKAQRLDARSFDLEADPPADVGVADLALCLEVAEHLPPPMGETLVRFLIRQAENIVFSAAHPGQGGTGHVNEQPKQYWIDRFEDGGGHYDAEASRKLWANMDRQPMTRPWYRANAMVFRGLGVTTPDVVEG
jgi:SAM-dependent methyltransferase